MLNYMKILLGLLSIFVIFTILSTSFGNRFYLPSELKVDPVTKEIKVYKEEDVQLLIKHLDSKHTTQKAQITIPVTNKCPDNKQEPINYLKKYIGEKSCPSSLRKWSPGDKIDMKIMLAKSPNNTHSIPIARALVFNFPIELAKEFEPELRWLYRSWIEMQKYEPTKWRTDLVIFIRNDPMFFKDGNSFLEQLNCKFSNRRTSKSDRPMCTLVEYVPLRDLKVPPINANMNRNYTKLLTEVNMFSDKPEDLTEFWTFCHHSLKTYPYVDSVVVAFSGYSYFKSAGFDFLIRSDMDVFLTPLFATWLPYNCDDFYAGNGGYSTSFNAKRLGRIAKDLGISNAGVFNLGSTWYSTPDQFRVAAYLGMVYMSYLYEEEFTSAERKGELEVKNWPDWHYGVLSMYGNAMALNHLAGSQQMNVVKLDQLIDFPSTNNMNPNTKLHIHVFHGYEMFSKFTFKANGYDNITAVADKDMDKISFYCLRMALDGKRIAPVGLKAMLDKQIERKN